VARHRKRRRDSNPLIPDDQESAELASTGESPHVEFDVGPEEFRPDLFGPSEFEGTGDAPQGDAALAAMLMLGEKSWQRIDGMGMARLALEAEPSNDRRYDLTGEQRFLLANGRAWCLVVHGDLGHQGRRDDPIVIADALRHWELAKTIDPESPELRTTEALIRLRQGRPNLALEAAQRAVQDFGGMKDGSRTGRTQGAALLAVMTLALATAATGKNSRAKVLATTARALRVPMDVDDAAFRALVGELAELEQTVAAPDAESDNP
jgi:hypothetical protein